ncbi:hypothetical protein HPB51_012481 [Rhipicephalus microplus]|uniref:Uncharacterized protein n=1 Tax=Rhipicephalus microplus TaxID=6941 RepID=A0A9J6EAB2_RHIMP|nr:hypothetical protein HPB51_012481 [Rhipicephalus microplus]
MGQSVACSGVRVLSAAQRVNTDPAHWKLNGAPFDAFCFILVLTRDAKLGRGCGPIDKIQTCENYPVVTIRNYTSRPRFHSCTGVVGRVSRWRPFRCHVATPPLFLSEAHAYPPWRRLAGVVAIDAGGDVARPLDARDANGIPAGRAARPRYLEQKSRGVVQGLRLARPVIAFFAILFPSLLLLHYYLRVRQPPSLIAQNKRKVFSQKPAPNPFPCTPFESPGQGVHLVV